MADECYPDCIKHRKITEAKIAEYERQWPNHCQECRGHGFTTDLFDPSPSGITQLGSGKVPDVSICPHCLEIGKCPRCGEIAWPDMAEYNGQPCPHCGYVEGETWGKLDEHVCQCGLMREMEEADRLAQQARAAGLLPRHRGVVA